MKRFLTLMTLGVMVPSLSACQQATDTTSTQSRSSAHIATSSSNTSTSQSSWSSSTSSSQEASSHKEVYTDDDLASETAKGLWTSTKSSQLHSFVIDQWGPSFNPPQYYKEYSPANPLNYYGVTVPGNLITPQGMTPDFEGVTPDLEWSTDGKHDPGKVALVAVYSDLNGASGSHLYLFTITDGKPQVWITEQNQGNQEQKLYFRQTQNAQLADYFRNLVTG